MRSFILKLLCFVGLVMLFDVLLFILLLCSCVYFKPEEAWLGKNYPESEILILGTSHAKESFDPREIRKHTGMSSFNLGRALRNLTFNDAYTSFLIEQGRQPKLVVITVTYDDFREITRPYMISAFIPPEQRIDLFIEMAQQKNWLHFRHFFFCDRFSTSIRMNLSRTLSWLKTRDPVMKVPIDHHLRGFQVNTMRLKPGPEPPEDQIAQYPFTWKERNVAALKSMLKKWSDHGVKVLLVDTPEFIGSRLSRGEYDQYENFMNQLAEEGGASFVSFNRLDQEYQKKPELFKDGGWGRPNSHLNIHGVKIFSQQFCDWLKSNDGF